MRRVEHEIESYPLPDRLALLKGVQGALDGVRYRINDRLNPEEPDPELKTPEPVPSGETGGPSSTEEPGTAHTSTSSKATGAEATSAPGEPGAVSPTGGPLEG